MMFPWARQISSVLPITVMILPFVWPFLGHVAYYPLPWLVRIVPSFPDRPWSQSSSSEYNGNLDTVNLTADVNSNLQRSSDSRTTLSERCFPLGHEMGIASSDLQLLVRASFLLTGSHQTRELHWD